MTRHRGFISAFLHVLAVFTLWIVTGGLGVQDAAGVLAAPVPRLSNIKADSLTASNTFLVSLPRPLLTPPPTFYGRIRIAPTPTVTPTVTITATATQTIFVTATTTAVVNRIVQVPCHCAPSVLSLLYSGNPLSKIIDAPLGLPFPSGLFKSLRLYIGVLIYAGMVVLLFWDHEGARKRMSEDPSISHEDCIRLQGPPKLAPENDSISAPPDTPITVTESDVSPDLTGSTVATAPNTPADSIISAPPTVGAAISTPATPTMPVSPRPAPLSTVTVATTTAASVAPAQLVAATAPDAQTTTSSPTRTVVPLSQTLIAPHATRKRIDMPTADLSTTMMQLERSQANYDRLIKADRELHERTRASLAQYDAFTAKQQNPIIKKLLPLPRPSSLSSSVPSIVKDTKTAAPLPRLSASVPASRSTFISRVTGRPNRYLERFGPAPVGDTQRMASSETSPAPSTPTPPAKQPSSAATSSVSSGQPSVPDANTDTISRAHSSVTDSISPTKTTPRLDRMFDGTLEEPKGGSQLIIPPSVTGDFHPHRASTPIADIASSASAPATSSAKIASCLTPSTLATPLRTRQGSTASIKEMMDALNKRSRSRALNEQTPSPTSSASSSPTKGPQSTPEVIGTRPVPTRPLLLSSYRRTSPTSVARAPKLPEESGFLGVSAPSGLSSSSALSRLSLLSESDNESIQSLSVASSLVTFPSLPSLPALPSSTSSLGDSTISEGCVIRAVSTSNTRNEPAPSGNVSNIPSTSPSHSRSASLIDMACDRSFLLEGSLPATSSIASSLGEVDVGSSSTIDSTLRGIAAPPTSPPSDSAPYTSTSPISRGVGVQLSTSNSEGRAILSPMRTPDSASSAGARASSPTMAGVALLRHDVKGKGRADLSLRSPRSRIDRAPLSPEAVVPITAYEVPPVGVAGSSKLRRVVVGYTYSRGRDLYMDG